MKVILGIAAWLASGALGSYIADSAIVNDINTHYDGNMKVCREDAVPCAAMTLAGPINLVGGTAFAALDRAGMI